MATLDRSGLRGVVLLGTAAAVALAVGVARAGNASGAVLPHGPFGLWRADPQHAVGWAVVALFGITGMVLAFLRLYQAARERRASTRLVAIAAVLWSAPMLLAPPVLSLDAWSYLAQGTMVGNGIDPYRFGPSLLGPGTLLDAVSPVWRDTPAPYGPLMLGLLCLVVGATGGHLTMGALLLRVVVVVAVVITAVLTVRLSKPGRAPAALALVAANPLVVIHLVGGIHLDALLAVLAAATIWSVRGRRYLLATVAAATAFAIKLPGIVLVGYVLALQARRALTWRARVGAMVGSLAIAVTLAVGYALVVPDGWGWISAMDVPGQVRIYWAPASLIGSVLYAATVLVGAPVTFTEVLAGARSVVGAVGSATVAVLLWRSGAEPSWRRGAALVGLALLAVAVSAPALHAWYVLWGAVLLAVAAPATVRRWAVVLGVALSFSAVPDQLGGTVWSVLAVPFCLLIAVAEAVRTVRTPALAPLVTA